MATNYLPFDDKLPNWRKLNNELNLGSFKLGAGVVLGLAMLGIGTEIKGCTPGDTTATIEQTSIETESVLQSKIPDRSSEESE